MNIRNAILIVRYLGFSWIGFRIWKIFSEKLGYWERRIPSTGWNVANAKYGDSTQWKDGQQLAEQLAAMGVRFFFDGRSLPQSGRSLLDFDGTCNVGQSLIERNVMGKFPFFSGPCQDFGPTPDWFLNPIAGTVAPSEIHFSRINEFGFGDVKAIWELNRFGFVFDLARAYARTGDERCGERFWELFCSWLDRNPPYEGINWKCGQESGLRMIAVVFGYFSFRHHPSFTGLKAHRLMCFVAATGLRIERQINYAISQRNNHGISEAVALWTIGVLFPNLKRGRVWREKGSAVLTQLCHELIYDDGGFCQHSSNYHRLLLHLLAWVVQLAKINGIELPGPILMRFGSATRFLYQFLDQNSGRVPRFGNDDGALLFPLNHCDYQDYRPILNLCFAILNNKKNLDRGPWDEDLFWFGLGQIPVADGNEQESQLRNVNMKTAGCHVIREGHSSAFIRAGSHVHRPCHLDSMHVDIWAGGNNVAIDSGTYSYNGPNIWKDIPFSRSDFHNSITVDRKPSARRISKFLYVPWPSARLVSRSESPDYCAMFFQREMRFELNDLVTHWRVVCCLPNESWMILDRLLATREHEYRLHWLLGGEISIGTPPNQVSTNFENGIEYHLITNCPGPNQTVQTTADLESGLGFYAPRYLELAPALSHAVCTTSTDAQFASLFGFDQALLKRLSKTIGKTGVLEHAGFQEQTLSLIGSLVCDSQQANDPTQANSIVNVKK